MTQNEVFTKDEKRKSILDESTMTLQKLFLWQNTSSFIRNIAKLTRHFYSTYFVLATLRKLYSTITTYLIFIFKINFEFSLALNFTEGGSQMYVISLLRLCDLVPISFIFNFMYKFENTKTRFHIRNWKRFCFLKSQEIGLKKYKILIY